MLDIKMETRYCERFDVRYKSDTGEYTESKCSGDTCEFCINRPVYLKQFCQTCDFALPNGEKCMGMKRDIRNELR